MSSTRGYYFRGFRDGAPFVLVVVPFALLFGVVATEAGLSIVETMSMTVLVIAGAAQFTALQLLSDNAPTFIAILTALAVNMRMAMYSASMVAHFGKAPLWKRVLASYFLVDQTYGVSFGQFEREPAMSMAQKFAYFFGSVTVLAPMWYGFSFVGAVAGKSIPPEYALDFAIPITFIAIVAPSLRSLPHVAAALVSIAGALALVWIPYNLGLMIAAVLAMMVGAGVEKHMMRRMGALQ
jgi:branched chain amino acid efflux pump